jgi:hypothetical protein
LSEAANEDEPAELLASKVTLVALSVTKKAIKRTTTKTFNQGCLRKKGRSFMPKVEKRESRDNIE